jgi:hypothetical protein
MLKNIASLLLLTAAAVKADMKKKTLCWKQSDELFASKDNFDKIDTKYILFFS